MKTNTRVIRVNGDVLTLGPKAIRDGDNLCYYCSAAPFCTRIKTAKECDKFIPTISFTNPVGLEGSFTTLRLGMAWNARLKIAKVIGLYDKAKDTPVGLAKVTDIVSGPLGHLIELTAENNHSLIGSDIKDKAAALRRIIRNHYGSNFAADDRTATAIYCERINGKEYSRLQKTWTVDRKRRRRSADASEHREAAD